MFWIWALLGLPVLVLFIRRFMRIPCQKKLLHTPYAQHGNVMFHFWIVKWLLKPMSFNCSYHVPDTLHYSKILIGRIYLAYEMVKHPRRLAFDMKSKIYEKLGLVPTSLENEMEQPKTLRNRAVYRINMWWSWFRETFWNRLIAVFGRDVFLRYRWIWYFSEGVPLPPIPTPGSSFTSFHITWWDDLWAAK